MLERTIASTLQILSVNTEDMNQKSLEKTGDVIGKTLENALAVNLPVTKAAQLTNIVANIIGSTIDSKESDTKDSIKNLYETFVDGLGTLNMQTGAAADIVLSTKTMQVLVTNKAKKLSTVGALVEQEGSEGVSLNHELHLTSYDFVDKVKKKQNVPITLSVTKANLYTTADSAPEEHSDVLDKLEEKVGSNPLRTLLNCNVVRNTSVTLKIQNIKATNYNAVKPLLRKVKVQCNSSSSLDEIVRYNCSYPSTDSSKVFTYPIYGTCITNQTQILTMRCPYRRVLPSCHLSSSMGTCSVLNYTSTYTFCRCLLCVDNLNRRLEESDMDSVAYQVSGMAQFIFDDYAATMKKAAKMDVNTLEKSVILISTFGCVWAIIITIVVFRYGFTNTSKSKSKNLSKTQSLSVVPDTSSSDDQIIEVKESPQKLLHNYLLSYMPKIYQQQEDEATHTWIFNIIQHIFNNHSFFSLLFSKVALFQ